MVTAIKREKLYTLIREVLRKGDFTAKEIAEIIYQEGYIPYPVRQAVAPRLTELEIKGIVETVGSKEDHETHKHVSIYGLVRA